MLLFAGHRFVVCFPKPFTIAPMIERIINKGNSKKKYREIETHLRDDKQTLKYSLICDRDCGLYLARVIGLYLARYGLTDVQLKTLFSDWIIRQEENSFCKFGVLKAIKVTRSGVNCEIVDEKRTVFRNSTAKPQTRSERLRESLLFSATRWGPIICILILTRRSSGYQYTSKL